MEDIEALAAKVAELRDTEDAARRTVDEAENTRHPVSQKLSRASARLSGAVEANIDELRPSREVRAQEAACVEARDDSSLDRFTR